MQTEHTDTVLFVTHTRYFGGSAVSLRTVLRGFPPGIRRVLAAPEGRFASELVTEGVVDDRVAIPWEKRRGGRQAAATVMGAARLVGWGLRRRRLVAVHANSLADLAVAAPLATLRRVPVVVWVHDDDATTRRARHIVPIVRRLGCRIRLAAVSQAGADALVACRVTEPAGVTVVPNPIDPAWIVADRRSASDAFRIGFVGTDTFRKGFDMLPEVVSSLDRPDVRLLVFARRHEGRPLPIEHAWDALGRFPLSRVEIVGRQDDVRAAYARCDMVLCPSRQESFCRVAAEAMANGLPVVASDLPPVREVLDDGRAGLLFPPGDVPAAVTALRRLVDEPGLRGRLGDAGRNHARSFAADQVVRRLLGLYSDRCSGDVSRRANAAPRPG